MSAQIIPIRPIETNRYGRRILGYQALRRKDGLHYVWRFPEGQYPEQASGNRGWVSDFDLGGYDDDLAEAVKVIDCLTADGLPTKGTRELAHSASVADRRRGEVSVPATPSQRISLAGYVASALRRFANYLDGGSRSAIRNAKQ